MRALTSVLEPISWGSEDKHVRVRAIVLSPVRGLGLQVDLAEVCFWRLGRSR